MKNFKKEFDFIQNYKTAISDIQNKTFIIETDKKNDMTKVENETVNRTVLGEDCLGLGLGDNVTVIKSVFNDEKMDLISNLNYFQEKENNVNDIPDDNKSNATTGNENKIELSNANIVDKNNLNKIITTIRFIRYR